MARMAPSWKRPTDKRASRWPSRRWRRSSPGKLACFCPPILAVAGCVGFYLSALILRCICASALSDLWYARTSWHDIIYIDTVHIVISLMKALAIDGVWGLCEIQISYDQTIPRRMVAIGEDLCVAVAGGSFPNMAVKNVTVAWFSLPGSIVLFSSVCYVLHMCNRRLGRSWREEILRSAWNRCIHP